MIYGIHSAHFNFRSHLNTTRWLLLPILSTYQFCLPDQTEMQSIHLSLHEYTQTNYFCSGAYLNSLFFYAFPLPSFPLFIDHRRVRSSWFYSKACYFISNSQCYSPHYHISQIQFQMTETILPSLSRPKFNTVFFFFCFPIY